MPAAGRVAVVAAVAVAVVVRASTRHVLNNMTAKCVMPCHPFEKAHGMCRSM
jgi:hypothetical protein